MAATDKTVDPALWPLVEAFPPIDLSAENLSVFREALLGLAVVPDPASHPDVRVEEVKAAGSVRCLLFRPTTSRASAGALLHIHGGGFVMGAPEMDVARNIELARATGCTILSVDYRLAPEHPHPAGLEDCHAALAWLASQTPGRRVGVIGESAGGGLAASLALMARDRGSVELACQVLIYPMLAPPSEVSAHVGRYIWTRGSNGFAWSAYLSGAPANPATIAGLAPDVSRLPPTFLAVGELDLFVYDNLSYVNRLLATGCSVEAHLYPGAIHGFDRMVDAPVSIQYTRALTAFITRHL
jgi:triacylglycerol lipase